MGCRCSMMTEMHEPQISSYLTEKQIHLVRETWQDLSKEPQVTGVQIFNKLFEDNPHFKPLFVHLSRDAKEKSNWVVDDSKLQNHAIVVMEALGAAVESLDDSEQLTLVLYALGRTHRDYCVTPAMLKRMWPCVQQGLRYKLGEGYTDEIGEAWQHVFMFIIAKITQGIQNA